MKQFSTKRQLIWYFLKGAKRYFLLSACFAVLVSLTDMLSPKLISFTVDSVIGSKSVDPSGIAARLVSLVGGLQAVKSHPYRIALLVAAVGLTGAILRYLFRSCNVHGAETFVKRMRDQLFDHILHLPFSWLGENSTGDIIQRCTSDVQTIKQFVAEQLTSLVRILILIVMAITFMVGINREITLVSAAFIPIIVGYSLFFYVKIGDAFEKACRHVSFFEDRISRHSDVGTAFIDGYSLLPDDFRKLFSLLR